MSTEAVSTQAPKKKKKTVVKLVKPIYDSKREGDSVYAAEYEQAMEAYNKRLAKREKERLKRKEYAAKLTPEMKKQDAIRDYSREYLKQPANVDTHIDRAIHLIILVQDTVPEGLSVAETIKLADTIAATHGRKPDESIKDREARIRKSMERAKQQAAMKVTAVKQ